MPYYLHPCVTARELAIGMWAQQVLQEVLYNILGLHKNPPDLARTLEEIESLQVQHMGGSANTPCGWTV
ncbi:hypothetical protein GQ457_16G028930 [Hibiscus cannabinus]